MSIHWLPEQSCPVFNKLTRHEPAIQSKNQHLVSGHLKKHLTSMSCQLEPAIWSRDTGQRIPCFDRCQLIKTWLFNTFEVHSKPRLHVSLPPSSVRATSNTASHDNHEKVNSWVSFCFPYEYGAPLGGPSGRGSSAMIAIRKVVPKQNSVNCSRRRSNLCNANEEA